MWPRGGHAIQLPPRYLEGMQAPIPFCECYLEANSPNAPTLYFASNCPETIGAIQRVFARQNPNARFRLAALISPSRAVVTFMGASDVRDIERKVPVKLLAREDIEQFREIRDLALAA